LLPLPVSPVTIIHGQPVKVVYMTNGDYTGLSSGYTREGEAVTAQTTYLGTTEDDLIFLGYPDFHLQEVYTDYPNSGDIYTSPFGQSVTYGNRGLGRSDYHSYQFGSPALYNRYNIVLDLQQIISTYRPQHIYTTSEFDTHPDHFTTYQLLKLALAAVYSTDPTYTPVIQDDRLGQFPGYKLLAISK
jgi:LmbE family N-acetylglucosaminyl deacetylase